ncbi:Hypothetical protein A7982_01885 [Minicystis rosea]|nr:Hypothetical protein A7982_01885 [Minicystis rosea]
MWGARGTVLGAAGVPPPVWLTVRGELSASFMNRGGWCNGRRMG